MKLETEQVERCVSIDSREALIRNATTLVCPKCGTQGNMGNIMRWHFDNCKTILRNCKHCNNTIPIVKPYVRYSKMSFCNSACYYASKVGHQPAHVVRNGGHLDDQSKQKISEKFTEERKQYHRDLVHKTKPWKTRWDKNNNDNN